jgi:ubiquitin C-terminal hydrolase
MVAVRYFLQGRATREVVRIADLRPFDPNFKLEAFQYARDTILEPKTLEGWIRAYSEACAFLEQTLQPEFVKAREQSISLWNTVSRTVNPAAVVKVAGAVVRAAFDARYNKRRISGGGDVDADDAADVDVTTASTTATTVDDNGGIAVAFSAAALAAHNDNLIRKAKRKAVDYDGHSPDAAVVDDSLTVNPTPHISAKKEGGDDDDFVVDSDAPYDADDISEEYDDIVTSTPIKSFSRRPRPGRPPKRPAVEQPAPEPEPLPEPQPASLTAEPASTPTKRRAAARSLPQPTSGNRKGCAACRKMRDATMFRCERCSDCYHASCLVKIVDDYRANLASNGSTRREAAPNGDDQLELTVDDPDLLQDRADALAGKPPLSWYCVTCRKPTVDAPVRNQHSQVMHRGVAGLLNVANTCYINSAVQVVHALAEFSEPLTLCMTEATRAVLVERKKKAPLPRNRVTTAVPDKKPEYKLFCEIEEQARLAAASLVQGGAENELPPVDDDDDAIQEVDLASVSALAMATMPPTVSTAHELATTQVAPKLNDVAALSTPELRRAKKQQRYVDALQTVVVELSGGCQSVTFNDLVYLKSASGSGLALKYFTNIHQDINEYMTHALECVHELTKVRDEDDWTAERAAEARDEAAALLARDTPLAPFATSKFSTRMLAYCAPQRTFIVPTGPLTSVPLVNPEAFGDASAQRRHREAWERYLSSNRSLVASVFDGMFTRIRTCPQGHNSYSDEMFRVLSLTFPVEVKTPLLLSNLIAEFNKPETLECRCDQCEDKLTNQNFSSITTISHYPAVLALHFSRFRTTVADEEWGANKIKRDVRYPLNMQFVDVPTAEAATEGLEQAATVADGQESEVVFENARVTAVYDLVAVICHSGTYSQGHYYTFVRDPSHEESLTNHWFKLDDAHVTRVSAKQVQSSQAYMLFYRKRGGGGTNGASQRR